MRVESGERNKEVNPRLHEEGDTGHGAIGNQSSD